MQLHKALFAAGCFWGVQYYFDQVPGVLKTTVGYTGGHVPRPSYEQVCYEFTGHAEATLIEFNPEQIGYEKLLEHFFRMHNPTQLNRQGPDIGDEYRSEVFYFDDEQREAAEAVIAEVRKNYDAPIVTKISEATDFYPAEDYHQKFTEHTGRGACHIPYKEL